MLYDPKWEAGADLFSTDSLIAWLGQRPPNEAYCYVERGHCLIAQYLADKDLKRVRVYPCGEFSHFVGGRRKNSSYPDQWDNIAVQQPTTFGGALARARALTSAHRQP